MIRAITLLLLTLAFLEIVHGYGSGAPKDACIDMLPQHHTPEQSTTLPYIVMVNKKTIRGGDKVTISIAPGSTVKDFQGFLVQARVGETPVGQFVPDNSVKVIDCGSGKANAATHTKADKKTKISIQWVAPPNLSETVKFYVTVAKNGGEFWVRRFAPGASVTVKSK